MKYKIIILISLLLPAALLSNFNWPMYRGNHYLTGNNDEIVPDGNYLNWKFTASSFIFYPVSYNGMIFIGGLDKKIYCINERTGELLWSINLNAPVMKSPVTYKNYLAVTAGDFLYVITINNGHILWSRKEGVSVQLSTPIIINGIIFYGSRKFFYARFIENGHLIWKNTRVNIYGGTPIYWNKKIYFISKNFAEKKSILMCLNAVTGSLIWQASIPSYSNIFTPVVYNKKVFISAFDKLYCFDALSGSLKWVKQFKTYVASSTVFANNNILLSLMDGYIYLINPVSGSIVSKFTNFNPTGANFIIAGETAFISDNIGNIHSYNYAKHKENWIFQTKISNRISTMSANNGRLYVAIANTLFSISKGIITEPLIATRNIKKKSTFTDNTKKVEVSINSKEKIIGTLEVSQNNKITKYKIKDNKAVIKINKRSKYTVTLKSKDYFITSKTINKPEKSNHLSLKAEKIEANNSYNLNNINFKYNSAELSPDSIPVLNSLITMLKAHPHMKLEIRGHTDNVGSAEYNLKLSLRRAEKVKEYLVKNGITDTRLKARGLGESKPIAPNDTEEGRQKNRRTEFYIIDK